MLYSLSSKVLQVVIFLYHLRITWLPDLIWYHMIIWYQIHDAMFDYLVVVFIWWYVGDVLLECFHTWSILVIQDVILSFGFGISNMRVFSFAINTLDTKWNIFTWNQYRTFQNKLSTYYWLQLQDVFQADYWLSIEIFSSYWYQVQVMIFITNANYQLGIFSYISAICKIWHHTWNTFSDTFRVVCNQTTIGLSINNLHVM